ncbi:MAG: PilZ domain-containing protein [Deltaproteobacteria bacterium]|nr:PilZ domain-containing protein [Deltaproteobacteria bacterium]
MSEVSSKERRRDPRVAANLEVRISTIEPERDPWTGRPFFRASQETCGNVSRGGAFVRTAEEFTPGRRLLVELKLPDGSPLEAIGRVAWTKRVLGGSEGDDGVGVGVEFIGGSPEQLERLELFVDGLMAP